MGINEFIKTARRGIAMCMAAVLILTALAACGAGKAQPPDGDINEKNLDAVCAVLKEAGLSNIDVFETWVRDYLDGGYENADASGFCDADCRMTVTLLAGDFIECERPEPEYGGTYLMFDLEAIENQPEYSVLKDKKALFTTLFGEMPIPESGFSAAFTENLEKHGIRFSGDKFSVISILIKSYEEETAFVGHTGLLIDCRENGDIGSDYLFVEKIAFNDVYKATPVKGDEELVRLLSARPDYMPAEGDPNTLIYKNAELIGEIAR